MEQRKQNNRPLVPERESADHFLRIIRERRSIRKYREFDIPDEDIEQILRAAQLAPSTNNSQPWRFVVVRSRDMREILSEAAGGQRFIAEASAIVVVIGMRTASCCPDSPAKWYALDTMIAAEHIVLAGTALGYGTCWIAMFQSQPTEVTRIIKETLNIPNGGEIVALVTIGFPDEAPAQRPRLALEEIAYSEKFGNPFPNNSDGG